MILAYGFASLFHERISEQRWYRDLTRQTPFHSVVIDRQVLSDGGMVLTVDGHFTKRRECVPIPPVAVQTYHGSGSAEPAGFVSRQPGDAINRPPLDGSQAFGPWDLIALSPDPLEASVWIWHKCSDGKFQYNQLFRIPWDNTP